MTCRSKVSVQSIIKHSQPALVRRACLELERAPSGPGLSGNSVIGTRCKADLALGASNGRWWFHLMSWDECLTK